MTKAIMPGTYSWGTLHRKTPNERAQIATELLRAAHRDGAPFIKRDGTITILDKGLLFAKFFSGDVDTEKARNLVKLLVSRGVLKSDGKPGRGGATLTLLDPKSPTEPVIKKAQPRKAAVSKAPDSAESEGLPAENTATQPVEKLTVRQLREQLHRRLNAGRHEEKAAAEHRRDLEVATRVVDALDLDDNMDSKGLKDTLNAVHRILN